MGGGGGLERTDFSQFHFGGCGGPDRPNFKQFLPWAGVVVLKDLIFHSSILGGCGVLEITDFYSFYFGQVWQSSNT